MSWDKTMLIGEEIKPIAIAITKLCLSEGISKIDQSVSQLVHQSVSQLVHQLVSQLVHQSVSQLVHQSVS